MTNYWPRTIDNGQILRPGRQEAEKALKTYQMVFHSDIDQPVFYHDLAPPRPYTFLRVYETHKSESCSRITLSSRSSVAERKRGRGNGIIGLSGMVILFAGIPLHFCTAGKWMEKK